MKREKKKSNTKDSKNNSRYNKRVDREEGKVMRRKKGRMEWEL